MLAKTTIKELADLPVENQKDYSVSINYLKKSNKILLHNWLIYKFLKPFLTRKKSFKILDVGTGIADLPIFLANKLKKGRCDCLITGIDTSPEAVAMAKQETINYKNIHILCSNIESIHSSYDIIIASQVFHHFSPYEATSFLKKAYKKATLAIIISDLIRSRVVYWMVKLFVQLTTTNRFSRNDGPHSVLRCYSDEEIRALFIKANIQNYKIYNVLFRKFVVVTK